MYCDNCGTENRDGAKFCYQCQQSFSHIPAPKKAVAALATEPISSSPTIDESTTSERFSHILSGRYELKEMLGRGGMGMVYRAYDRQLKMHVAVKFLLDRYIDQFVAIDSLRREARAAMQLAHPNIIRLYNFEDTPDAKYLLMELISGESLASMASRKPNRRFTEIEVVKYISEVCEALKYAHVENVIHRDIKPSNILVTLDGRVKLADFGVAVINETASSSVAGDIAGTPTYMSPEQLLGQALDGRSDIYSLGMTMYEMLAGAPPFRGENVSYQHIYGKPMPIRGVSERMNAVVLKCLRKEREGRWRDAAELKDVLTGKKDIGIAMQGAYRPEWLRVEAEREMGTPVTPSWSCLTSDLRSPHPQRAAVCKTPQPVRSSRVHERVGKIRNHAGLADRTPEREQARMGFGTLAGIAGGIMMAFIGGNPRWSISHDALFQLSWILYGGLIGMAIGIAQRRTAKVLLSSALGIMGGIVAGNLISSVSDIAAFSSLKLPHHAALCGTVFGASLGVSDGIYEKSSGYSFRCFAWGGFGGATAVAGFLVIRYAFSAFWMPLLDWIVLGAALGFFVNMGVSFAEKPWTRELKSE